MTGRPFAGMLLGLLIVGPLLADDKVETPKVDPPKLPDVITFDKLVIDSLRLVHNRGADLYNTTQNFEGTYRTYQGGLLTVRPLLAHRPGAQKLIDEGIEAADKEPTVAKKAFRLHEAIESVRKHLKDVNEPPISTIAPEPIPKPKPKVVEPPIKPIGPDAKAKDVTDSKKTASNVEAAPSPHDKKTVVEEKKTVETKKPVEEKKVAVAEEKKPVEKKAVAEEKKPIEKKSVVEEKKSVEKKAAVEEKKSTDTATIKTDNPMGVKALGPSGKAMLKGQPLTAAEVTVVSLDQKNPRVFTATIQPDGSYKFVDAVPPGKYVVIVTAKAVPDKYQTTTSSGLVIEVKAAAGTFDIELK